jgi:hypothetical protein
MSDVSGEHVLVHGRIIRIDTLIIEVEIHNLVFAKATERCNGPI